MVNDCKIAAVCTSEVHNEDTQSFLYSFHKILAEKGWREMVFAACTDMFCDTLFDRGEASVYSVISYDIVDVVIIMGSSVKNEDIIRDIIDGANRHGKPVIVLDDAQVRDGCININYEESDAFGRLVAHLADDHGLKKFACIAGFKGNDISEKRVEVFKKTLSDRGIPFDETRLGYGDFYSFPTRAVMERFIADERGLPEAIVCINDSMAITACEVLAEHGISVPEDIVVTGFDGIQEEKYNFPRLTTCLRDTDKLTEFLCKLIVLADMGVRLDSRYVFPYVPVFSESCGCCPKSLISVNTNINSLVNKMNEGAYYDRSLNNMVTKLTDVSDKNEIRSVLKYYFQYNSYIFMNEDFDTDSRQSHSYENEPHTALMDYNRFFFGDNEVKTGRCTLSRMLPDWGEILDSRDIPIVFSLHNQQCVYGYMTSFASGASHKDFSRALSDMHKFMINLDNCVSSYVQQEFLRESNEKLKNVQNEIIMSFANMVESRDNCTGKHIKRTSEYLRVLVAYMSNFDEYKESLTAETRRLMYKAAPLHDIGKIKVSDTVLNKPGRLNEYEFEQIKLHTVEGYNIIKNNLTNIEEEKYVEIAQSMALYHHEKWDGSGYPTNLSGKDIPLCARIMSVVDVFDALTSKRVYKPPFSSDRAFAVLRDSAGSHFDPDIVSKFLSIRDQVEEILKQNPDADHA
ncbi:MAG: substrate-binding domain-containing protein [Ruminococcus sp.]|nr:substrate-binding domain-containing protein [Ruminococcus sp.]